MSSIIQFQFRRGSSSQWSSVNPVLADGELAIESDTRQFKIGNGVSTWNSLAYGGLVGPQGTMSNIVTYDISFNANIFVGGDTSLNGRLKVSNDASLNSNLYVGKDVSLGGNLIANKIGVGKVPNSIYGLDVVGGINMTGGLYVNGNPFSSFNYNADLNLNANLFVSKDASLSGKLYTVGDASLNSNLFVGKDVSLGGNLIANKIGVGKIADISYGLDVIGNINMTGGLYVNGNLFSSFNNNADLSLNSNLFVGKDVCFNNKLNVIGNTTLANTSATALTVTGNTTLANTSATTLIVSGNTTLANTSATTLTVSGNTTLANTSATTLTVSGNTTLANTSATTLTVTGNTTVNNTLFVSNINASNLSLLGNLTVLGNTTTLNVNNLDISDNIIRLNKGSTSLLNGSGIEVELNSAVVGNLLLKNDNNWYINSSVGEINLNSSVAKLTQQSYTSGTTTTAIVGNVTISDSNSKLVVVGDASLNRNLFVGLDTSLSGKLRVLGTTNLIADASLNSNLFVGADTSLSGKLRVQGDVSLNSNLFVGKDSSFSGKLRVAGDVSFGSNLDIVGALSYGSISETFITIASQPAGSYTANYNSGLVRYIQAFAGQPTTFAITNLPTTLNKSYVFTIIYKGATTSFKYTAVSINGTPMTLNGTGIAMGSTGYYIQQFYIMISDAVMANNLVMQSLSVDYSTSDVENTYVNNDLVLNSNLFVGADLSVNGTLNVDKVFLQPAIIPSVPFTAQYIYNFENSIVNSGSASALTVATFNNPTYTTGKIGLSALTTNGTNQYATLSSYQFTSSGFSIAFWFKTTTTTGSYTLFDFYGATGDRIQISTTNGTQIVFTVNGTFTSTTSITLNDGNWRHFAFTMSYTSSTTGTIMTYINGELKTTSPSTMGYPGLTANKTIYIGCAQGPAPASYTSGSFDQLIFTNRVFNQTEPFTLYSFVPTTVLDTTVANSNLQINGFVGNILSYGGNSNPVPYKGFINLISRRNPVTNSDRVPIVTFQQNGSNNVSWDNGATIAMGPSNINNQGTSLDFVLSYADGTGNYSQSSVLTIISDSATTGRIGINNTSPSSALDVTGTAKATVFTPTSDYRIKTDVQPLSYNNYLDALNPVSYFNTILGKRDIGFIAHEVQSIIPELVFGEKDGEVHQTLNYFGLIAVLTREIQELKKTNQIFLQNQFISSNNNLSPIINNSLDYSKLNNIQIGYQNCTTSTVTITRNDSDYTAITNTETLPAGVWLVEATSKFAYSTAYHNRIYSLSTAGSTTEDTTKLVYYSCASTLTLTYPISATFVLNSPSTIYFMGSIRDADGNTSNNSHVLRWTRIA